MGAFVELIGWACDLLVRSWLSAPPLAGVGQVRPQGGLKEPVEFNGWGPVSQEADPGGPVPEGTEG